MRVDLSTGTLFANQTSGVATLLNSTIQSVGNGWLRISVTGNINNATLSGTGTMTCSIGVARFDAGASSIVNAYAGDGNTGFYIWGSQFEVGTFATPYIPSTTTFTSRASSATYYDSTGILRIVGTNQPRYGFGYDTVSGKWVSQGLVLESAATNLNTSSEKTGGWNTDGTTTPLYILSPTPFGYNGL
jgi:hypothetical protein